MLTLVCALAACARTHDFDVEATNVGSTTVDMRVSHVDSQGNVDVRMSTQLAPGATSGYVYKVENAPAVRCEVRFAGEHAGRARFDVPNGDVTVLSVMEQDGGLVVTPHSE